DEPGEEVTFKEVEIVEASSEPVPDEVPMGSPASEECLVVSEQWTEKEPEPANTPDSSQLTTDHSPLPTSREAVMEVPPVVPFPTAMVAPEPPATVVKPAL